MDARTLNTDTRFDRLQDLLLRMHVGEQLRPDEAAQKTGLPEDTCRAVLRGLERAGLMTLGHDEHFVRCALQQQGR